MTTLTNRYNVIKDASGNLNLRYSGDTLDAGDVLLYSGDNGIEAGAIFSGEKIITKVKP